LIRFVSSLVGLEIFIRCSMISLHAGLFIALN
jgi:hypothetical protein